MSNILSTDFSIRLRDGRSIGVASVGKIDGFPIIHCHGSGSSRLEVRLLAEAATALGVRLIGLDRPGIGCSDAKAGYQLLDWPDDVLEVADQLGIEQFAVEGVSAGGPYAMACAYTIPHRLTACGLVSTVSPGDFVRRFGPGWMRAVWWVGARYPGLLRSYARLVQQLTGSDEASMEKYLVRYGRQLGAADQRLLGDSEIRGLLVQAMAESYRQGGEGNLAVVLAEVRPWGFSVEQIACEKLFVWHGEQDRILPIAPVRRLAQVLPHCTTTFYPDEGHFSTLANHAWDILHALCIQRSSERTEGPDFP